MIDFINTYREDFGVEPICRQLPIDPSTYYLHMRRAKQPETAPPRVQSDVRHKAPIQRVWDDNQQVYGARKVWHQLKLNDIKIARCTVERLMRELGLRGVTRRQSIRVKYK